MRVELVRPDRAVGLDRVALAPGDADARSAPQHPRVELVVERAPAARALMALVPFGRIGPDALDPAVEAVGGARRAPEDRRAGVEPLEPGKRAIGRGLSRVGDADRLAAQDRGVDDPALALHGHDHRPVVRLPGFGRGQHRRDGARHVEPERLEQVVESPVARPAGTAGSMLEPCLEEAVGRRAGERLGSPVCEMDQLEHVVERDRAAPGRVDGPQAVEVECGPLDPEPLEDGVDGVVVHAAVVARAARRTRPGRGQRGGSAGVARARASATASSSACSVTGSGRSVAFSARWA